MPWFTRCCAKVNLFLSVGPKDERGWHPLRTVFQAIDLFDSLTVELAEADLITSNVDYLPQVNTVSKALEEYRKVTPIPPIAIRLEKAIPPQSGLGGGSSDAAGLLRILQRITNEAMADRRLQEIAVKVGADVPFFLIGGRVRAEGYGEIISPELDPAVMNLLIAKPSVDCSTPLMFRSLDEIDYPWKGFSGEVEIYNDFQRVAPQQCLDLIDRIENFGALASGLSGSGSAVFGVFEDRTAALTASELLQVQGVEAWVCRSLRREECHTVESRF